MRASESLEVVPDIRPSVLAAFVRTNLGLLDHVDGRLASAELRFTEARDLARELGHRLLEGVNAGYTGTLALELGRAREARAWLEEACEVLREVGDHRYEALFRAYLACVDASAGRLDAAETSSCPESTV